MRLPLAQTLAQGHALLHALAEAEAVAGTQTGSEHSSPAAAHCSLCLAAAGVDSPLLAAMALPFPPVPARHRAPEEAAVKAWLEPLALGYRSRAPPRA